MIDASILVTIIPPIVTGVFAYLIARKKNAITEKLNKAKVDAEIQTQALTIVRGVMNDMRDEFKREIASLKEENEILSKKASDNEENIKSLNQQLQASEKLIATLRSEIDALQLTIKIYEGELNRLRGNDGK